MLSSAEKVKGQGVGSAFREQVNLVTEGLKSEYQIDINKFSRSDIMHYHTIDVSHFLSIPFAKRKGTTVGYVHFLPETVDGSLKLPKLFTKIFYKYIIKFYDSMDHLVTVNPIFIDKLAAYGISKEKVKYIPNFVSEKDFYPLEKNQINNVRAEFGVDKNAFVVLGVGQIQTRKGVLDFIETAKALPDVQFVWAGGFSFGKITDGYEELKKVVDNPPTNVKFIGIVDRSRMNDIYNMTDVLFQPSYNELFPMAILEAMNCQVPLVLRDLELYEDILFDFYKKSNNNQGFIDIISKLHSDKEFYKDCSESSFRGHQFYSREHVLSMWKDFYDEVYIKGRE